jgi:hypothetical protein
MVWFFERGGEFMRIETSFDRATGVYVLRAQLPDGTEQVESFNSETSCQSRLEMLDQQLQADRWRLREVRRAPDG